MHTTSVGDLPEGSALRTSICIHPRRCLSDDGVVKLTANEVPLISAATSAVAVLVVGILNVWSQNRQQRLYKKSLSDQQSQAAQQIEQERNLRLVELREQAAHIIRNEKFAAYTRALVNLRAEQAAWSRLADLDATTVQHEFMPLISAVAELKDEVKTNAAEVELVASPQVFELLVKYQEMTAELYRELIGSSEAAIAAAGGQPTVGALVTALQAIQGVLARQDPSRTYVELREAMRAELYDLALSPNKRPTSDDLEALREKDADTMS